MSQSNYKKDYTNEDLELDEIEKVEELDNTKAIDPVDENWKDRYGNLRSHAQKEKVAKDQEIAKLRSQLEESGKKNTDIPVDPAQFKEWMETYPTVANNVRAIVAQEIKGVKDQLGETTKTILKRETDSKLEAAKNDLSTDHPEFYGGSDPIVKSKEFWEWLDKKEEAGVPTHKQNFAGDNPKLASDSLTLYKLETNYGKTKKPKANSDDGASSVRGGTSTTPIPSGSTEYKFTESQLEQMNPREWELREEEIDEAIRQGQVKMDISG